MHDALAQLSLCGQTYKIGSGLILAVSGSRRLNLGTTAGFRQAALCLLCLIRKKGKLCREI